MTTTPAIAIAGRASCRPSCDPTPAPPRSTGSTSSNNPSRERIAQLAAGDSLALPPPVVAYLDRMRELGFRERLIEVERDSWILISAQMPDEVTRLMGVKRAQIEDERLRGLYLDIGDLADCAPDDPRMPGLADRVAAFIEAAAAEGEGVQDEHPVSAELVELLDAAFVESFPSARRLLTLLEERGWTGWTDIRRSCPGG